MIICDHKLFSLYVCYLIVNSVGFFFNVITQESYLSFSNANDERLALATVWFLICMVLINSQELSILLHKASVQKPETESLGYR